MSSKMPRARRLAYVYHTSLSLYEVLSLFVLIPQNDIKSEHDSMLHELKKKNMRLEEENRQVNCGARYSFA